MWCSQAHHGCFKKTTSSASPNYHQAPGTQPYLQGSTPIRTEVIWFRGIDNVQKKCPGVYHTWIPYGKWKAHFHSLAVFFGFRYFFLAFKKNCAVSRPMTPTPIRLLRASHIASVVGPTVEFSGQRHVGSSRCPVNRQLRVGQKKARRRTSPKVLAELYG